MGKSLDIKSKSVASRVPMAEYIRILQESSNMGITVSDYVALKLSSNVKLETGGAVGITTVKEVDKKETIEKVKNLQKEVSEQKNKAQELEKEINALKSNKMPNKATLELLDKLFKLNSSLFSIIDGKTNPYFDLVVKIQSELNKN